MFFFSIIAHKERTNDVIASAGNIRLCTDFKIHAERASLELHPSLSPEEKLQGGPWTSASSILLLGMKIEEINHIEQNSFVVYMHV